MSDQLRGKHIVVTGGAGTLGAAIATALAAEGADLTLMGRTRATLEDLADPLARVHEVRVKAVKCDVSDAESVMSAFETAVLSMGPVDALINNAGIAPSSAFEDTAMKSWHNVIAVNLTGTFLCTREVLPAMLASRSGRIVNIASTAGLKGYARVAAYCAAKHGVVGLTRALATETVRTGVTVNAVCPGYIEGSAMLDAAIANVARMTGKSVADARAILAKQSPRGTFATKEEVATAVVRLCSAEGAGTTGQAIVVAGGEVT